MQRLVAAPLDRSLLDGCAAVSLDAGVLRDMYRYTPTPVAVTATAPTLNAIANPLLELLLLFEVFSLLAIISIDLHFKKKIRNTISQHNLSCLSCLHSRSL